MSEPSDPIASLLRFDGTVSRQTYALVGFIGFAIKHNIDRVIARDYLYGIHGLLNYWAPLNKAARLAHLSDTEKQFLFKLVIVSLPFIYIGVNLTVRRLRDAALPLWLVCLFFTPFVNVLFFLVLCLVPSKNQDPSDEAAPWPHVRPLDRFIPRYKLASILLSIGITTIIGLVCLSLSTRVLGSYGWSLFIALPFCMGLFAVLLHSYHEPRSFESCLEVSLMPIVILAAILLAIAVEGIICLMMAAPIALFLALLGGSIGFVIQLHYWDTHYKPAVLTAILFLLPSAFFGEHAVALKAPDFVVRSAVEINAPPEAVWGQVIAFAEIPPPQELLFRAGVAYPIRAEISGSGVGAIRQCIFSTGSFEEPITVWDEPHLLRFSVSKNPAPLNELSPYKNIHAPHLHGYFISHSGQFLLTALPGGRTRLEGTTWYRHSMWPATYWSWWSNYVIHSIHMRVLNHIRERAESQTFKLWPPRPISDRGLIVMRKTRRVLQIVLPGGSGQVGNILARHFHANGHSVVVFARRPVRAPWRTITWDGLNPGSWIKELDGADVLINLTGRNVNCRYNAKNRQEIMESRVHSTRLLGEALNEVAHPPRLWMNASTATIYRHALDRPMDEYTGEIGGNEPNVPSTWRFSIQVATQWEKAFFATRATNIRKIALRSAVTMSPDPGGIFDVLLRLVRFGIGGASGSGKQYVSWIHEQDFVRAIDHLIANEQFADCINLAAPNPLPNREFMRALRNAYGQKIGLPATEWMLELGAIFLRTETELILKSRRVLPGKLLENGFQFTFPDWPSAARDLVNRWRQMNRQ